MNFQLTKKTKILLTNNYEMKMKIDNTQQNWKYWLCRERDETINDIAGDLKWINHIAGELKRINHIVGTSEGER